MDGSSTIRLFPDARVPATPSLPGLSALQREELHVKDAHIVSGPDSGQVSKFKDILKGWTGSSLLGLAGLGGLAGYEKMSKPQDSPSDGFLRAALYAGSVAYPFAGAGVGVALAGLGVAAMAMKQLPQTRVYGNGVKETVTGNTTELKLPTGHSFKHTIGSKDVEARDANGMKLTGERDGDVLRFTDSNSNVISIDTKSHDFGISTPRGQYGHSSSQAAQVVVRAADNSLEIIGHEMGTFATQKVTNALQIGETFLQQVPTSHSYYAIRVTPDGFAGKYINETFDHGVPHREETPIAPETLMGFLSGENTQLLTIRDGKPSAGLGLPVTPKQIADVKDDLHSQGLEKARKDKPAAEIQGANGDTVFLPAGRGYLTVVDKLGNSKSVYTPASGFAGPAAFDKTNGTLYAVGTDNKLYSVLGSSLLGGNHHWSADIKGQVQDVSLAHEDGQIHVLTQIGNRLADIPVNPISGEVGKMKLLNHVKSDAE